LHSSSAKGHTEFANRTFVDQRPDEIRHRELESLILKFLPQLRGRLSPITVSLIRFQNKARSGRKDFLPVEPQGGLSFLFLLSAPRFA
jgi:hypothetical protein